ncbi:MAG: ECF-type sigma factor [Chiayiivirga sp.]|jgi:RNA polymerase sigma factor (TIGR02999 family)|uniref:ECF-type sigma factor n=1 Tax=Denitratimonas tolerans TaxID=1338420 RepID=A0AAW9RCS8_9GAMM|nr:ECF-type sigma factor [Xanthomonadaceae bacterium]MDX9765641.1 ECF-type sigma factor [Chiayiivirga sp.]HMN34661.1 ECF-type sigma factor [Chiayiivirga sp.]HRO88119.1 ECF-type sigma factor [Chiayiivirga sp.]
MDAGRDIDTDQTCELARRCAEGDAAARDRLFAAVYDDLRQRAHRLLRQSEGATLSTTALVHETYLKLAGGRLAPQDRAHFHAIAAAAMRQVLLNAMRDRVAAKRGGGQLCVTLGAAEDVATADPDAATDLFALDAALTALAREDARLAQVVELHFFAGLGFAEIAELVALSERTVARDWRAARALLRLHMAQAQ